MGNGWVPHGVFYVDLFSATTKLQQRRFDGQRFRFRHGPFSLECKWRFTLCPRNDDNEDPTQKAEKSMTFVWKGWKKSYLYNMDHLVKSYHRKKSDCCMLFFLNEKKNNETYDPTIHLVPLLTVFPCCSWKKTKMPAETYSCAK